MYPFPLYLTSRSRCPQVPMPNFVDQIEQFCDAQWVGIVSAKAAEIKYEQTNNAKYLQYAQWFRRFACEDRARETRYNDGSWRVEYGGGAKLLLNSRNQKHASWPIAKELLRTQLTRYHSGLPPLQTNDQLPMMVCEKPKRGLITCRVIDQGIDDA